MFLAADSTTIGRISHVFWIHAQAQIFMTINRNRQYGKQCVKQSPASKKGEIIFAGKRKILM